VETAAAVLDEKEHVVAAEEDALDREEIACDDTRRLGMKELAPARAGPSRRRPEALSREQAADTRGRCLQAELR
jgi:hypothetical protein